MKLTKETIWHFTCDFCKLWWSFASSDEFQPRKNVFCPHCGKERTRCKKVRPFIWVTDPETGKKANTGERHKHCYFHF